MSDSSMVWANFLLEYLIFEYLVHNAFDLTHVPDTKPAKTSLYHHRTPAVFDLWNYPSFGQRITLHISTLNNPIVLGTINLSLLCPNNTFPVLDGPVFMLHGKLKFWFNILRKGFRLFDLFPFNKATFLKSLSTGAGWNIYLDSVWIKDLIFVAFSNSEILRFRITNHSCVSPISSGRLRLSFWIASFEDLIYLSTLVSQILSFNPFSRDKWPSLASFTISFFNRLETFFDSWGV